MASFTPVNQVRLTNVAIVRLKRGGKRYEIACYKNKVVNWRTGAETDLSEVLQIDSVFHNVSRGQVAKASDLVDAFGTSESSDVCKIILAKGQLQVSDKERQVAQEALFRDIAAIVSEKCVNAETKRPFTVNMIEKTMKSTLHYAPKPGKTAKQQALDVMKRLSKHIPILRAMMRVRLTVPAARSAAVEATLSERFKTTPTNVGVSGGGMAVVLDCEIQPGHFRALDEYVREVNDAGGQGLEVMDMHVHESSGASTDISSLDAAMSGLSVGGESKVGGGSNQNRGMAEDNEDENEDEPSYKPPSRGSRNKRKKKKRRGRGQESQPKRGEDAGRSGGPQDLTGADAQGAAGGVVDLCGYAYRPYKSVYFVLTCYDQEEVNPATCEPQGRSKWHIFGAAEKPAMWNQGQNGWLVSKKFAERLDVQGAILVEHA